jgi:hypothetical protein
VEIAVTAFLRVALAADATAPLDPAVLLRQEARQRALAQVAHRVGSPAARAVLQPAAAVNPHAGRAEVDRREAPPGRAVKLAVAGKPDAGRAEVDRREAPPGRAVKLAVAGKPDAGRAEVDRREALPEPEVSRTAV